MTFCDNRIRGSYILLLKPPILRYSKPLQVYSVCIRNMDPLHFSLFNYIFATGVSRADTRGVKRQDEKRIRAPCIISDVRLMPGMAKKGRRDPHVKMPKHNVTVLFTAASVNMRNYELLVRLGDITLDACVVAFAPNSASFLSSRSTQPYDVTYIQDAQLHNIRPIIKKKQSLRQKRCTIISNSLMNYTRSVY